MNKNCATIDNLLAATEGEHIQFKEAKTRFDSVEAARICCALAHLAELGIVEGASISKVYRSPIGDLSVATTDKKEAIKNFIQEHGETKTADLVKAFSLSDGYMRALLREMVGDETLEKLGDRRYARYKLRNKG